MRLIFIFIMMSLGTTANSEGLFSWLFNSGKEITAEIKLVNKCQLDSKYFIVRDLESGKSASFTNGFAKLATKTKSSIQFSYRRLLKCHFRRNAVAAKKMKLVADCSERNLNDVSKN